MDITKVDLCNCKAGDQGVADLFEGLKCLEMLTSITYQQDTLLEKGTSLLLEILKRRKKAFHRQSSMTSDTTPQIYCKQEL